MDRKSRAGVAENGEIVVYYKLYNYICRPGMDGGKE